MSDAETRLISDWSTEGGFSAEDSRCAAPPGQGKFLLKIDKEPGTPFEVVLTTVERDVNDTNRGWAQARTRHHGTPRTTPAGGPTGPADLTTSGDPRSHKASTSSSTTSPAS